jgi:ferrous iron transport protein A
VNVVATLKKTDDADRRLSKKKSGRVSHFGDERLAGKLLAMGVLPGSRIELRRRAPFGGGWYVKVDNLLLALRQQEIDSIVLTKE